MMHSRFFRNRLMPVLVILAIIMAPVVGNVHLRAASSITVDLQGSTESVKPGDIITVNLSVSSFPNLTRFGPIEVQYDSASVSFVGLNRGSEIPSTFDIANTATTGVIAVTGIDETIEDQIASNLALPTTDPESNPTEPPEDPSMFSSGRVILCEFHFEVLDTTKSEARFWISNVAGFRDSSMEQVSASIGNIASVPVDVQVSSDASLTSLSLNGVKFNPEFSPAVFEYTASVSRNVTDVVVHAAAYNLSSQVFITGDRGLQIGENELIISVIAQDMVTTSQYTIYITRLESLIPEGAALTDSDGHTYDFMDLPANLVLPSGFVQSSISVGGVEVPAFVMEGLIDVLLYLQDETDDPKLYVYSPAENTVRDFDANSSFFRSSRLYTVVSLPEGVLLPEGFTETDISFRNNVVRGYLSEDGKTSILYMKDNSGKAMFYTVDSKNNDIYPYVVPQQKTSGIFGVLFIVFLIISVLEASMIAIIIVQIRKRKSPAPNLRRV